ncbi:MAG TPA: hypothetical protein VIK52_00345 [Opitutaceae bacterium]
MNTTAETLIAFLLLAGIGLIVAIKIRKRGRKVHLARELAEIFSLGAILIALFMAIWVLAFERGGYWWLIVGIYFCSGLIVGERMKKRAEELVRLSKRTPDPHPEPTKHSEPGADRASNH